MSSMFCLVVFSCLNTEGRNGQERQREGKMGIEEKKGVSETTFFALRLQ